MWPQIPGNLNDLELAALGTTENGEFAPSEAVVTAFGELEPDALKALAAEIKTAAQAVLADDPDADAVAEVKTYTTIRKGILSIIKTKAVAAELAESLANEEDEDEDEDESTEHSDSNSSSDDDSEDEEDDEDLGDKGDKGGQLGDRSTQSSKKTVQPDVLQKLNGTPGAYKEGAEQPTVGETFGSWKELADALVRAVEHINPGSDTKHYVAQIPGRFAEGRVLNAETKFMSADFEEEVVAAMCAPLIPVYDLACANTTRRPVANSLPAWRLDQRGGVTIYPSPTLDDITGGTGVWTYVEDADPEAVKNACQTIDCATPEEYRIYGVYRCITIKNLLAMTFPELVEAYLNRLAAAHARLAETQLLEAMATGADTVTTLTTGYNATTRIQSAILNYLALYQEEQRWDIDGLLEAWMPRWVIKAIQMDYVRRRRTDGGRMSIPSMEEITGMFRAAGVNPHYFIDRPSWATALPTLQTAGELNQLPRNLEILIAPPGKFALMDRGELRIGVTGNNVYRDKDDLLANQFTMFFENFEGIVNTNTCPAHIIELNDLCYNGQQIDDVAINCEGADYAGIGS